MTIQWEPETALQDVTENRVDSVLPGYEPILKDHSVARYDDGEGYSLWGVFSYADVERAAIDAETFSSVTVPEGAPRILPLMADPPEHSAYKRLFTSFFRAPRMAELEAQMRPQAIDMLETMIGKGSADFAAEFAYAFPTRSLVALLSLESEWQFYDEWSHDMEVATRAGMRKPGAGLPQELFSKVVPDLLELIRSRRENPGADVISRIVTAGLDGEPFTDEEVMGLAIACILAGRSTTASGIGNLVLRLASDQELQQFLRENPDRIPDSVEEGLRIDTPQQEQPRRTKRDVEFNGYTIPADTATFINYGSANVDPKRWSNPGVFNLDRDDKRDHLAFGRGPHTCPGAPMGRMQMRVALEELLARTSSFSLTGPVERKTWPRLSVERLPLTFVPVHGS